MKRLITLVLVYGAGLLSHPVLAQNLPEIPELPDPSQYVWTAYGILSAGPVDVTLGTGYGKLLSRLKEQGIRGAHPPFGNGFRIGAGMRYRRWFGELALYRPFEDLSLTTTRNNRRIFTSTLSCTDINFGYALYQDLNYYLVFRAGIGVLQHYLSIQGPASGSTFDLNRLTDPPVLTAWPILRHTNGAAYFCLEWANSRPKKPGTVGLSTRLGYNLGLSTRAWESPGIEVLNAPSDRAGMLYLSSLIWLGQNREAKKRRNER